MREVICGKQGHNGGKQRTGWLVEKNGSIENYSNFKSNGRASNEKLKRPVKICGTRTVGTSIAINGKKNSRQKITRRS